MATFVLMQGFSTRKLKVETEDGRNCTSLEAFSYEDGYGRIYNVPAGSESDGASTPPILWEKFNIEWIPPFGWYYMPTRLHDWAYRNSVLPKSLCDSLLKESMDWIINEDRKNGVINWVEEQERRMKADLIYEGVALGGENSFDSDRKAQNK